jgi:hypothetical protein
MIAPLAHIPVPTPVERTRVVSLNTDSVNLEIAPGDEDRALKIMSDWEASFGLTMERTRILHQRSLNINSYISLIQNDDGTLEIKGRGSLNPCPGINADHNRLIIPRAIGHWMLTGGCPEQFIRDAAARKDILAFAELRSTKGGCLRWNGEAVGKLCRVYRSNDPEVGTLTKDAHGKASAQTIEKGFAYLPGIDWPEADDVDIDWYVTQMRLIMEQTSVEYRPQFNIIARRMQELGLEVYGHGGAASNVVKGEIVATYERPGKSKKRGFSGDRSLAIAVTKGAGVLVVEPGYCSPDSLILTFGAEGNVIGEVHDRTRMERSGMTVLKLKKSGADFVDKGKVAVHDPDGGFEILSWHEKVEGFVDERPLRFGEKGFYGNNPIESDPEADDWIMDDGTHDGVHDGVHDGDHDGIHDGAHDHDHDHDGIHDGVHDGDHDSHGESNDEIPHAVTNDDFLAVMFGEAVGDCFVYSNQCDPKDADWKGGPIEHAKARYQNPERQNYTCVSTFNRVNRDGLMVYSRREEHFAGLYFVVLDDISIDGVGGKVMVDPRTLGFGEPTCVIETSPGNSQWFYRLSEPVLSVSAAKYLMGPVLKSEVDGVALTDQGARGVTRICKLPEGRNLKKALGSPFQNQVLAWNPKLSYSPETICGWFGREYDPDATGGETRSAATAEVAAECDLVQALEAEGLLLRGAPKETGWWDIICPWSGEHSDGRDDGTAIKIHGDGSWTFKCQHGHCADRKAGDLHHWLAESGYSVTAPGGPVKRIDVSRLNFDREEDLFYWVDEETGEIREIGSGIADREVLLDMGFTLRRKGGDGADLPSGVGEDILRKLAFVLGLSSDEEIESLRGTIGYRSQLVDEICDSVAWHSLKRKFFILRQGVKLCEPMELEGFVSNLYGKVWDRSGLIQIAEDFYADSGMTDAKRRTAVEKFPNVAFTLILNELKLNNQFASALDLYVDPFIDKPKITWEDGTPTFCLPHKPFDGGKYRKDIVDDYREHFPELEKFLRMLVAARFADDRKQAYIWLKASSNWGKSVLLHCLDAHKLVVQTSIKELKQIFSGAPSGKTMDDFRRSWILMINEFKGVCSEVKQLEGSMSISPKNMPMITVPLYLKVFLSAEEVHSLLGPSGLIEDQFGNRISLIDRAGKLNDRPLFAAGKGEYVRNLTAFIGAFLNSEVDQYVALGKHAAGAKGDSVIAEFYKEFGILKQGRNLNSAIDDLAVDFSQWVIGCFERANKNASRRGGASFEDRNIGDLVEFKSDTKEYLLRCPAKAFDKWLDAEIDSSEQATIAHKKKMIFDVMGGSKSKRLTTGVVKALPLVTHLEGIKKSDS